MLIRERLGRIRGKFKGGPGSLGVFAAPTNIPSTRQPNPPHALLQVKTRSPSPVSCAQPVLPQIEYQIVSGTNAVREDRLREDSRVGSLGDPLGESLTIQNDSAQAPLAVPALSPVGSSLTVDSDPAPHTSAAITNTTSPPTYASIGGADTSTGQEAILEPVAQTSSSGGDYTSDSSDAEEKNQQGLDANPDALAVPSKSRPISSSPGMGTGSNKAQETTPSPDVSTMITTPLSLASSAAASKLVGCMCAYLAEWRTRPLFPFYFLQIFVFLLPLII